MLFKRQNKAVNEILEAFKTNDRVILGWYTGSGKTEIFLHVAKLLAASGLRVGISSYLQTNIRNQTEVRAKKLKIKSGVVLPGKNVCDSSIQIFNPQTLFHREPITKKFDVIIVDESHVGANDENKMLPTILAKHCKKNVKILGVSATYWDMLGQKIWKNAYILSRGLDKGLKDGRVQPFKIHVEQFNIHLQNSDYNVNGDLKKSSVKRHKNALRSLCKTKMELLLKKHDREIGKKCLVICPKGNNKAYAKYVQSLLPRNSLILTGDESAQEENILKEFQHNPKIRFLIVISKCRVGFDQNTLESVIDLSLTRNIQTLVQTFGRIARLHPDLSDKKYFYVADSYVTPQRLNTLFSLALKFACCDFSGYVTGSNPLSMTIRTRIVQNFQDVDIRDILKGMHSPSLKNCKTFHFSRENIWDLESCKKDALEYNNREAWRVNSSGYAAASKHGWREECCKHMVALKTSWTLESCKKEAAKFKTRKEWNKRGLGSYAKAHLMGWLEECCKHMEVIKKRWTLEECKNEARKYKTCKEWKLNSSKTYNYACSQHWYQECSKHMKGKAVRRTLESCKKDARKYKTLEEWKKKSPSIYGAAKRWGYMEKCYNHLGKDFKKCVHKSNVVELVQDHPVDLLEDHLAMMLIADIKKSS